MSGPKLGAGQAASLDPALTYLFWYYYFGKIFYFLSHQSECPTSSSQTGRFTLLNPAELERNALFNRAGTDDILLRATFPAAKLSTPEGVIILRHPV